jgi:hypothetical protein
LFPQHKSDKNQINQHASGRNIIGYHLPSCLCKSSCYSPTFEDEGFPRHDKRDKTRVEEDSPKPCNKPNNIIQGHSEALALVNVHKNLSDRESTEPGSASADKSQTQDRDDLRRAKELVELHYEVKARHANGTVDEELRLARQSVRRVLSELSSVQTQ